MKPLAACLALSILAASGSWARAENLKITVFHTNDIHGWIMPRPAGEGRRLIGGAAALAGVVRREKGPKLLLDAGDWFQGTPEGVVSRGMAVIEVFNSLPYDAIVVGNHDFDYGEKRLRELIKAARVPVLGANVYRSRDGQRPGYLRPWIVKTVGGVRVGIFGLLTARLKGLSFPENVAGLEVRREADQAREAVRALRRQGAGVIIALTHVGFEVPDTGRFEGDQTLASEVEGIDLIVGGHTHTALRTPVRDATYGTLIVQAGHSLSSVGRVTLEVDAATGRVVSSTGTLLDLWIDETGEDPQLSSLLARQARAVGRVYDVTVATAAEALWRDRDKESPLGDWITDCSRDWAKTDVALQNAGGIRAEMGAGPVTLRTLFNIAPFDNRVVKLRLSGRLLGEVLDHGVGRNKGIIQVSGVSFSYSRDGKGGRRVARVLVGGRPLDPGATYSLSTIDFQVRGGDGYSLLQEAESQDFTRTLMRDVLRWCAERQALIRAPSLGRMRQDL